MLKRNDLAKQFELVVQQEIKNYNDSLNYILQSLRDLKDEIRHVREESLENHAAIHGLQNDMSIEIKALKESLVALSLRFERSLNDQRVVNERNALEMRDITSTVINKLSLENNFKHEIANLWNEIFKLKDKTDTSNRVLNDNLDDLLRRFRQEILKMKQEILEAPTEASLVRTQLDEKIAAHKVDVAGIMRELTIYKKDNLIVQKKIENIYTLIERLQKHEVTT